MYNAIERAFARASRAGETPFSDLPIVIAAHALDAEHENIAAQVVTIGKGATPLVVLYRTAEKLQRGIIALSDFHAPDARYIEVLARWGGVAIASVPEGFEYRQAGHVCVFNGGVWQSFTERDYYARKAIHGSGYDDL